MLQLTRKYLDLVYWMCWLASSQSPEEMPADEVSEILGN